MSQRFIRKDVLEKVRTLSAFDYLRNYAPDLLVKNGRTDYYHRDHDSLHFSNGKWYWWSQGKGGTSALDYLIIVEGYEFKDACNYLSDLMNVSAPVTTYYHPKPVKPFELPIKDFYIHLSNGSERFHRMLILSCAFFISTNMTETLFSWYIVEDS